MSMSHEDGFNSFDSKHFCKELDMNRSFEN